LIFFFLCVTYLYVRQYIADLGKITARFNEPGLSTRLLTGAERPLMYPPRR